MADAFGDEQQELAQLWKKARKDGCMSPWQQAKASGLKAHLALLNSGGVTLDHELCLRSIHFNLSRHIAMYRKHTLQRC